MARLPLGMGVSWRAHPPAEFCPTSKRLRLVIVTSCLFLKCAPVERRGCVHVWSGVKRNTTRITNLLSHAHISQLRCFFFPAIRLHSPPLIAGKWKSRRRSVVLSWNMSDDCRPRPQLDVASVSPSQWIVICWCLNRLNSPGSLSTKHSPSEHGVFKSDERSACREAQKVVQLRIEGV